MKILVVESVVEKVLADDIVVPSVGITVVERVLDSVTAVD